MINLKFECNKCKKVEIVKNPPRDQEQPFCFECGMPMFLEEVKVK